MWRGLDPTATKACPRSLLLHHLGHPWLYQATAAGKGRTPLPTSPSAFPLPGAHGNISVMRNQPAQRTCGASMATSHSFSSGRHESRAHSPLLRGHALCATETTLLHRCSPAQRPISASAATPLILPKSSCSIPPLQRVVVYFGMLLLFCKKCFVFV